MAHPDLVTDLDVLLRGGLIVDGSGGEPFQADCALRGDRIVAVGDLTHRRAALELDVDGLVVAPGFVNMLSWATESLVIDGRSLSDVRQGVTTEIFGEGTSMGPYHDTMAASVSIGTPPRGFRGAPFRTLRGYLEHLESIGVAPNVASFIGATTLRIHQVGWEDREATAEELDRMRALVRAEMKAGALGIGSSLIYAPACYSTTDELVALCEVAGEFGGTYVSHLRSEGHALEESVEELIEIARRANVRAEVYHLKAAGREHWPKIDRVLDRIEAARAEGLHVTADMYTYTAGATGLNACIPPWAQAGGVVAMRERFQAPETRERILREMRTRDVDWENLLHAAGSPERVLLTGFRSRRLQPLQGRTLQDVAREFEKDPYETILDLMVQDQSRVEAVYFMMSEENLEKQMRKPWVSLCSDAGSLAAVGEFLKQMPHPRAYGNFARFLGRYVRERQVLSLAEAVRRMTSLPAENVGLKLRGRLTPGYFADLAIFDANTIADRATYENPHQYAVGVHHVFVNGVPVLRDGEPTGNLSGRALRRER